MKPCHSLSRVVLVFAALSIYAIAPALPVYAADAPAWDSAGETDTTEEAQSAAASSGPADPLAQCEQRRRDAESRPPLKDLIDKVRAWCPNSTHPRLRQPPVASCCLPGTLGCKDANGCGGYDPYRHTICYCPATGCDMPYTLFEEYWHALQNCLKTSPNSPYPLPEFDCDQLVVPIGPGNFRCCGLDGRPSGYGPRSWCDEINAHCNNEVNPDRRMTKEGCSSFCGAYSDSLERKCCLKTCDMYFDACCNWIKWPIQDPPPPPPPPPPPVDKDAGGSIDEQ